MSDKKVTKYLAYALGEILLVVIGILIALSINNWNQGNQQQKELQGYLEKIAANMKQDIVLAKDYKARREAENQLCIQAFNSLQEDEPDLTLILAAIGIVQEFYFIANKSGFEALKTSGYIGKLKNQKLDSLLTQYYFIMDKLEREEISYNTFLENMEATWLANHSILPVMRETDPRTMVIKDSVAFSKRLEENRDVFLAQPVEAVIVRGASETMPQFYYQQLIEIGGAFIEEVEKMK